MIDLNGFKAMAHVGDARLKEVARLATIGRDPRLETGVYRDLPGMHYGRIVTWRAWAFRNPKATKYDRLILVARPPGDEMGIIAHVVPLEHVSGYPGAILDVVPPIDKHTGRWAKLWRVEWSDGTFDVLSASNRVRARFLAANRARQVARFGLTPGVHAERIKAVTI